MNLYPALHRREERACARERLPGLIPGTSPKIHFPKCPEKLALISRNPGNCGNEQSPFKVISHNLVRGWLLDFVYRNGHAVFSLRMKKRSSRRKNHTLLNSQQQSFGHTSLS
jgi:hypothetical protein